MLITFEFNFNSEFIVINKNTLKRKENILSNIECHACDMKRKLKQ